MDILDAYYKKTINYKYQDKELKFKVSQALFSSHIIDSGTQRLLRTFMNNQRRFNKILDLGCGYGPIGITLKILNPNSEVHMVDRDALALEYSRLNAELNSADNLKIYGSLGYDNVDEKDFDLIISNIPAKVGKNVLIHMLTDARFFLKKDGLVAIVVVDAIIEDVNEVLSNPDIKIILKKSWPGHTVFHYKFNTSNYLKDNEAPKSFESGLYDRTKSIFEVGGKEVTIETTFNLPEFDEMSYETQMLFNNIEDIKDQTVSNCLVFNVNQGHIPVALSILKNVEKMIIVDRNLQALKVIERNLKLNGFNENKIIIDHQVGINIKQSKIDCVVAHIDKKEGRDVNSLLIKQIEKQLTIGGIVYLVSSSNVITQIEKAVKKIQGLTILKRIRYKGESFLMFEKKSI